MDGVHGDVIAQEKAVREKQICYGNKLSKKLYLQGENALRSKSDRQLDILAKS